MVVVRAPSVVIWDVGDTLVRRVVGEAEVVIRALLAAGIRPDALAAEAVEAARKERLEGYLRWRTGEEEAEGFRHLAATLVEGVRPTVDATPIDRVGRDFANYFDVYQPFPGIPQLLNDLAARGIRQGVVSNWPPSLRPFLRHHGLDQYFEVVVCSAEEGVLKPDPGLLRRALARLRIDAAQAICVGNDPDLDIAPARALGMQTIQFDPKGQYTPSDARDLQALRERLRAVLALAF